MRIHLSGMYAKEILTGLLVNILSPSMEWHDEKLDQNLIFSIAIINKIEWLFFNCE